ncbi:transposition [Cordylochernes scorpioides]|uniref:Transposition n=1 Tax=Cordylochernes scorpioides TaxID=51811 RepID=A0ABY6KCS5_9ARAC|nr:transposition [Cordylochernes scorpioides]
MNKDIRKWAQACVNCQKCKVSIHTKSEIGKYQEVDERFSGVLWGLKDFILAYRDAAPHQNATASQAQLPSMLYNVEKFEGKGVVPFTKFIKDFELVYDLRALDDARKRILLDNHL